MQSCAMCLLKNKAKLVASHIIYFYTLSLLLEASTNHESWGVKTFLNQNCHLLKLSEIWRKKYVKSNARHKKEKYQVQLFDVRR